MKKISFLVLVSLQILPLFIKEASAIPVFARKYKTSCSTCHIAAPKRNAFGEAFRKNGYRMTSNDEAMVKEPPVSMGAEAWKKMFPNSIWPGTIAGTVPISLFGNSRIVWDKQSQKNANFMIPRNLNLVYGGVWEEKISFFGEFGLGSTTNTDVQVQFNDLFMDDIFNIRIGKLRMGTNFTNGNLTSQSYSTLNYNVTIGSTNSLGTYSTSQNGLEANGIILNRLEYALGVTNGSGVTSGATGADDADDKKDTYYKVAYKLGGMPFTGTTAGDTFDTKENWRDDSIQLGYFGYKADNTGKPLTRNGVDLRLDFSRFELTSTYVWGNNESLTGGVKTKDVKSSAYFLEGQAIIFPWMIGVVRYENEKFENHISGDSDLSDSRWIYNITMLQRANIRWTFEQVLSEDKKSFTINMLFGL